MINICLGLHIVQIDIFLKIFKGQCNYNCIYFGRKDMKPQTKILN